jgi:hypothetical protein
MSSRRSCWHYLARARFLWRLPYLQIQGVLDGLPTCQGVLWTPWGPLMSLAALLRWENFAAGGQAADAAYGMCPGGACACMGSAAGARRRQRRTW